MGKEIGSHFEYSEAMQRNGSQTIDWLPIQQLDYVFTFSGRSAIELALMDIKKDKNINSVYMPSYCCDSMLQPFKKHGIKIEFYDVLLGQKGLYYDIDKNKSFDIFFAMSYFGLEQSMDHIIQEMHFKNVLVLEDMTHRMLCDQPNANYSDYIVASLRKWFPIATGGILIKRRVSLNCYPFKESDEFVQNQIEAMKLKTAYLNGFKIKKQLFLEKYKSINEAMVSLDHSYKIDSFSMGVLQKLNINHIKEARKQNATILYDGLKEHKKIQMLLEYPKSSTPLFVPIKLKDHNEREKVRSLLIKNDIYCPVHWPISESVHLNSANKEIYDRELSLICDQRYYEKDMNKIVKVLREY